MITQNTVPTIIAWGRFPFKVALAGLLFQDPCWIPPLGFPIPYKHFKGEASKGLILLFLLKALPSSQSLHITFNSSLSPVGHHVLVILQIPPESCLPLLHPHSWCFVQALHHLLSNYYNRNTLLTVPFKLLSEILCLVFCSIYPLICHQVVFLKCILKQFMHTMLKNFSRLLKLCPIFNMTWCSQYLLWLGPSSLYSLLTRVSANPHMHKFKTHLALYCLYCLSLLFNCSTWLFLIKNIKFCSTVVSKHKNISQPTG